MRVILGILLTVAACDGGGSTPGLPDASTTSDAPGLDGLRVGWTATPPIPGPVKNDIDVATATFHLARVQVIGDGGEGTATVVDNVQLTWASATPMPQFVAFDAAPVGLYSKLALDVEGSSTTFAYELTGTVDLDGSTEPFRIYDTEALDIEVDGFDVNVAPGSDATMMVHLNIKMVLDSLDYASFTPVAGTRTLGPGDGQISIVRDGLTKAFKSRSNGS